MVVTGPEPEQVEDGCVVQLCHRGEPAELSVVLHKGKITPDKDEEVGGRTSLPRREKKKTNNNLKKIRENKQMREEERRYFVWSVVLSHFTRKLRNTERGDEEFTNRSL